MSQIAFTDNEKFLYWQRGGSSIRMQPLCCTRHHTGFGSPFVWAVITHTLITLVAGGMKTSSFQWNSSMCFIHTQWVKWEGTTSHTKPVKNDTHTFLKHDVKDRAARSLANQRPDSSEIPFTACQGAQGQSAAWGPANWDVNRGWLRCSCSVVFIIHNQPCYNLLISGSSQQQ